MSLGNIFKARPNYKTIFNELLNKGAMLTNANEDKGRAKNFRMSDLGYCMRQNYYKYSVDGGKPREPDFFKKVNYGSLVHNLYQNYLAATGKLFGNWYCSLCGEIRGPSYLEGELSEFVCSATERPTRLKYSELTVINNKLRVAGHPDGFANLLGNKLSLIEIKTITPYARIAESSSNAKSEHLHQANGYLGLLQEDATVLDFDRDVLLKLLDTAAYLLIYVDKGSDKTVPYDFKYDPDMWAADKKRIAHFWECRKKKTPPAPEGGSYCKYCDFIKDCNVEKFGG